MISDIAAEFNKSLYQVLKKLEIYKQPVTLNKDDITISTTGSSRDNIKLEIAKKDKKVGLSFYHGGLVSLRVEGKNPELQKFDTKALNVESNKNPDYKPLATEIDGAVKLLHTALKELDEKLEIIETPKLKITSNRYDSVVKLQNNESKAVNRPKNAGWFNEELNAFTNDKYVEIAEAAKIERVGSGSVCEFNFNSDILGKPPSYQEGNALGTIKKLLLENEGTAFKVTSRHAQHYPGKITLVKKGSNVKDTELRIEFDMQKGTKADLKLKSLTDKADKLEISGVLTNPYLYTKECIRHSLYAAMHYIEIFNDNTDIEKEKSVRLVK